MTRYFNREKIIYLIVIFTFVGLSFYIGYNHEPWADEAHAWLIARDTSFYSLFFKYLHTDGHPALWHIILKTFQFFGLQYKQFYIVPIIFSTIGVALFEFKSKFPLIIKILFPFTFFVFYQYTVVARGYCLLLPILSLIAIIWDKRFEKTKLFTFLILLLLSTEAYTYIFAVMIFLQYFYEIFKNKDNFREKKHIASIIIIIIGIITTFLYVHPIKSNTFSTRFSSYYISDSFFTPFNLNENIKIMVSSFIILYMYLTYVKSHDIRKFLLMIFYLLPVFCFYVFFYTNLWHFGIFLLLFLFIIWIQKEEHNKSIFAFLIITVLVQCYWNFSSCKYDLKNNYTGAKDTAIFLKNYDLKDKKIFGIGFYESAINPYFDYNIYDNWKSDIGFFYWNTKSVYYSYKYDVDSLLDSDVDIIVSNNFWVKYDNDKLKDKYNIYTFKGSTYVEDSYYEDQTYTVYIAKKIEKLKGDKSEN